MKKKIKQYRNKETDEIVTIKGFGTRLEESGKLSTMVWIKYAEEDKKAKFVRACDFDSEFEEVR